MPFRGLCRNNPCPIGLENTYQAPIEKLDCQAVVSSYVNMPAPNGSLDMDKMAAVVPVPKQQEVLDLKKMFCSEDSKNYKLWHVT